MKRSADLIYSDILSHRKTESLYECEWRRFVAYSELKDDFKLDDITEEMIIQYIEFLHVDLKYAPTTVWSSFSKINTKYQDLGGNKLQLKFPRLIKVLKQYQSGYIAKRAQTFSFDEMKSFLENSTDEGKNILHKAVVCVSLYGGLRCADLVGIENDDIEVNETTGVWVKYAVSKQAANFHKSNRFSIPKPYDEYVLNYLKRTDRIGRVFKNFNKHFTSQPMGVRTIAQTPSVVAKFLNLEGNYTGHCFRRSNATILAKNGATSRQLKTLFNWKGENTALNYIDNSTSSRVKMSDIIRTSIISDKKTMDEFNSINLSNATISNCVFNFSK